MFIFRLRRHPEGRTSARLQSPEPTWASDRTNRAADRWRRARDRWAGL